MADKPIKLTDAQLTTLQQVADPNYKHRLWNHDDLWAHNRATTRVLDRLALVSIVKINHESKIELTPAGRAYLDSLGIAPVALQPPPKTDKERIAELEAALHLLLGRAYVVSDQYSKTGYECRECSGWGIQKGKVEHYDWCKTGQANRIYIGSEE